MEGEKGNWQHLMGYERVGGRMDDFLFQVV
jgi:hypothetical protein